MKFSFILCVFLPGLALGASILPGSSAADVPQAPVTPGANVIVVLLDALRADSLGCYGYPKPTSPAIDSLSRQGFLFERCYSQSSWTKPSVASLMTGYMPSVHQAVACSMDMTKEDDLAQVLRGSFVTLAERFQAAGYRTGMFMWNGHCQKSHGFAQGFEDYWYKQYAYPADQTEAVLEWLRNKDSRPFFAYVHLRDPHGPYKPPEECYDTLYGDMPLPLATDLQVVNNYAAIYSEWTHGKKPQTGPGIEDLSEAGVAFLKHRYDGEILFSDIQIQRLLHTLEALGIRQNTTVVIVSDHGEEFHEHGLIGHGRTLYEEVVRVPLIIAPASFTQGVRVPQTVRMFDLYPSLLALCGLSPQEGLQAESLFTPDGALSVSEDRPACSELDRHEVDPAKWMLSIVKGPNKLILDRASETTAVFKLDEDPGEKNAGADTAPDFVQLRETLNQCISAGKEIARRFGPPEWNRQDEETQRALSALGYL